MISDATLWGMVRPDNGQDRLVYVPIGRTEYGSIDRSQMQPASIDVRLSHDLYLYDQDPFQRFDLRSTAHLTYSVKPGECVLGSLVERVQVPADMVGWVEGKSSIGRKFLKVHSAGFIDPGFHGDITLEMKNESSRWDFQLKAGMLIAQLRFAYLDAPAVRPYGSENLGSHYQMQIGTTEARL